MAILTLPDTGLRLDSFEEIRDYLAPRGIVHDRWSTEAALPETATQDEVLAAYQHALEPFMAAHGHRAADVISVFPDTPGVAEMRAKFLREHVHSEDEVRFFIEGAGDFFFNLGGDEPVVKMTCLAGDLISVPAGFAHWFDFGPAPRVRVIRVFTDPAGWVAQYTGSGVDARYASADPA